MSTDVFSGIWISSLDWVAQPAVIVGISCLILFILISLGGKIIMSVSANRKSAYIEDDGVGRHSFSIVVPTFNEGRSVIEKINRLSKLDYPAELLEVIFVDSSNDGTFELIRESAPNLPFQTKVLFSPRKNGLSGALDLAYSSSISDIMMKSDCDIVMSSDILIALSRAYSDASVGAASACGAVSDKGREKFEDGYRKLKLNDRVMESRVHSTHIFDTVATIRRELYTGVTPGITADDAELAIQAIRGGKRAILVPDANFVEELPTGKALREIKYRRAGAHLKLLFQNRDMLFSRRYGQFSRYIYPRIFALMTICPILFISGVLSLSYSFANGEYWDLFGVIIVAMSTIMICLPRQRVLLVAVSQVQVDLILGLFFILKNRNSGTWEASR